MSVKEIMNSGYSLIEVLMREYSYVMKDRYKRKDADGEVEGKDYEWVELPSWDDPTKTIKMKKYNDIAGAVKVDKNI